MSTVSTLVQLPKQSTLAQKAFLSTVPIYPFLSSISIYRAEFPKPNVFGDYSECFFQYLLTGELSPHALSAHSNVICLLKNHLFPTFILF